MRARIPVFLLSFVCLALPAAAQAQAPDVRALEEALARGLVQKDRAALDRLLAADFVLRGSPDVDRATWLDNAVSLCWGEQASIDEFSMVSLTFHPGGTRVAQQAEVTAPPPPRWETTSELSFVSTSGNTSTETLGVGGDVTHRSGVWLSKGQVAFVRAATDGRQIARSLGINFRTSRDLTPRAGAFAHAAYLRDTFAGIEHRGGVDGGLTWKLVDAARHTVNLDAGLGYTSETRLAEADRSFATGTLALAYTWALTDTAEITNDGGFTANLQDGPDWRFTDTVAVSASLNRALSLKLAYQVKYLNRPVPGWGAYKMPVDGLFMCGPSTHPGTGFNAGARAPVKRKAVQLRKARLALRRAGAVRGAAGAP